MSHEQRRANEQVEDVVGIKELSAPFSRCLTICPSVLFARLTKGCLSHAVLPDHRTLSRSPLALVGTLRYYHPRLLWMKPAKYALNFFASIVLRFSTNACAISCGQFSRGK